MISKEEVKHIAKLARLDLSEKEIEKMQKDMSSILDYFDLLKKAPKANIEKKVVAKANVVRPDVARIDHKEVAQKIIKSFPDKKEEYIKVKSIL